MSERDMQSLIALLEKRLGVAWTDVVEWLRSSNGIAAIEQKLVTGRLDEVLQDVQAAAEKFSAEVQHAYLLSGQRAAEWLDAKVPDAPIRFDTTAPELVAAARRNTLEQVYGLTLESRTSMQQALVDARQTGENPRVTASRIRDGLGLAPNQEQALANYRRSLEQGDWSRALGYELSDGHGDRTVRRLQRDGGGLTPKQVDDLSDRYRRNAITWRAETIARTESLRTAHEGSADLMRQAITRGDVDVKDLVKEWHAGPRTADARPAHQRMNEVTVGVLDDFELPDGTKMAHPGDPRGGVGNVANCRCTSSVTYQG